MDENKRQQLVVIDYAIFPVCGICKHGVFKKDNDFGECTAYQYVHQKHTGAERDLSVYRYGTCSSPKLRTGVRSFIHGYAEFLEDT